MDKLMIVIAAPNDYGKSGMLNAVIERLQNETFKYYDMRCKEVSDIPPIDCVAIGKLSNSEHNIGIATFGDTTAHVKEILNLFTLNDLNIIIMATHSVDRATSTLRMAIDYSEDNDFKLIVTAPYTEWFSRTEYNDQLNQIAAYTVDKLIKELIN